VLSYSVATDLNRNENIDLKTINLIQQFCNYDSDDTYTDDPVV